MTCNILASKDPDEDIIVTFDFTEGLAPGETIAAIISVVVTVNAGVDEAPNAILTGVPWIDPTGLYGQQPVINGLDNVTYNIQMLCATTFPHRQLAITGILPVRAQNNG
jgi:hypothetical protein